MQRKFRIYSYVDANFSLHDPVYVHIRILNIVNLSGAVDSNTMFLYGKSNPQISISPFENVAVLFLMQHIR